MARINIENLSGAQALSDEEQWNVQGGAIYMQYEGIRGDVTAAGHERESSSQSQSSLLGMMKL